MNSFHNASKYYHLEAKKSQLEGLSLISFKSSYKIHDSKLILPPETNFI